MVIWVSGRGRDPTVQTPTGTWINDSAGGESQIGQLRAEQGR